MFGGECGPMSVWAYIMYKVHSYMHALYTNVKREGIRVDLSVNRGINKSSGNA